MRQRNHCLPRLGLACALAASAWATTLSASPVAHAETTNPKPRWVYTTNIHTSLWTLLTLQPIYRDPIVDAILDSDRAYLVIQRVRSGLLGAAAGVQFVALDRQRGKVIWKKKLDFPNYLANRGLLLVGGRLVGLLRQEETDELLMIAINAANGRVLWQTPLPGVISPAVWERILDTDQSGKHVIVWLPRTKEKNRVIIRVTDGHRVAETTYKGYPWPVGDQRVAGLVFGYDGIPDNRKYNALLAFDEATGQLVWSLPLEPQRSSPPTVAGNVLLITRGEELLSINLRTGRPRWTSKLGGEVPVGPNPPVVIGSHVAVIHRGSTNPEEQLWKLSFLRLADGHRQAETLLDFGDSAIPELAGRIGNLVAVVGGYDDVLLLIDINEARTVAALNFGKLYSRLVYVNFQDTEITDRDRQSFSVRTADGRLRYYAIEDFLHLPPPPPLPRKGSEEKQEVLLYFSLLLFYFIFPVPLWKLVHPSRFGFWVLFYGSPLIILCLVFAWKPLIAWLRQRGIARAAKWGAVIGGFWALPAAIYLGLVGGMAAGFGTYGWFGPIWGAIVGFEYFLGVGVALGAGMGTLLSILRRRGRTRTAPEGGSSPRT